MPRQPYGQRGDRGQRAEGNLQSTEGDISPSRGPLIAALQLLTSTAAMHNSSESLHCASIRAANLAWRMFALITNLVTLSNVRLQDHSSAQASVNLRYNTTYLSLGASFLSRCDTAASVCRHTSTSLVFFSSAIAFDSSPTWAL